MRYPCAETLRECGRDVQKCNMASCSVREGAPPSVFVPCRSWRDSGSIVTGWLHANASFTGLNARSRKARSCGPRTKRTVCRFRCAAGIHLCGGVWEDGRRRRAFEADRSSRMVIALISASSSGSVNHSVSAFVWDEIGSSLRAPGGGTCACARANMGRGRSVCEFY